jgi:RNA polymerase sigma-70 factor (ECF subfamily)
VPDVDDAEDVVQEAMLRAATFENLDEERLGELLTSVTVRLCVDEHRRRVRAVSLRHRIPVDRGEEPGADERVCARAEAEWAADVVRTLPPMQQVVIEDRANGLSFDEISRRHRVSYKSVESSASRARAVVRRALAATLAAFAVVRRHVAVPAAVTTVAYATIALGAAGGAAPALDHPPMTRLPARSETVAIRVSSPAGQPVARAVAERRLAAPAAVAPRTVPAPRPSPYVRVGKTQVGPDENHDKYSTEERLAHCARYGVQLFPTIRCRYPEQGGGLSGWETR